MTEVKKKKQARPKRKPSNYKFEYFPKYREEYCLDLIKMLGDGHDVTEFCKYADISKSTFYLWCEQHEGFRLAYDIAKTHSEAFYFGTGRDNLYNKATFNVQVWNRIMSNRFGWSDKVVQEVDLNDDRKIEKMSEEELDKAIKALESELKSKK